MLPTRVPTTTVPTVVPTASDSESIPRFQSINVQTSQSKANVSIIMGHNGIVYCAAYSSTVVPTSISQIVSQQLMVVTTIGQASMVIPGLSPITNYSLFCLTKSFSGEWMSIEESYSYQQRFTTLCCKAVSLKVSSTSIVSGVSAVNFVTTTIDSLPSMLDGTTAIVLELWDIVNATKQVMSSTQLVPRTLPMTGSTPIRASVPSLQKGRYGISCKVVGAEAEKFITSFAGMTVL